MILVVVAAVPRYMYVAYILLTDTYFQRNLQSSSSHTYNTVTSDTVIGLKGTEVFFCFQSSTSCRQQ